MSEEIQRFLRRPEVERITGLSRSCIYDYISKGLFPQPIKLTARTVAWVSTEIEAWMQNRILATERGTQEVCPVDDSQGAK